MDSSGEGTQPTTQARRRWWGGLSTSRPESRHVHRNKYRVQSQSSDLAITLYGEHDFSGNVTIATIIISYAAREPPHKWRPVQTWRYDPSTDSHLYRIL